MPVIVTDCDPKLPGVNVTPAGFAITSLGSLDVTGHTTSYAGPPEVAAAVTIENGWLPSTSRSSTPVTGTVCGTFQLNGVNVSTAGATKPSLRSLDASVRRTFAVGRFSNVIVNVSLSPNSETTRFPGGAITKPARSLSRFVTLTGSPSRLL